MLEDNYFYYKEYNLNVLIKNACFLSTLQKKKVDAFLLYCWAYIAQPHTIYHYQIIVLCFQVHHSLLVIFNYFVIKTNESGM